MQASGYYDKNKGATLDHLGKPDEALKCYDKAIEINPNYAKTGTNRTQLLPDFPIP